MSIFISFAEPDRAIAEALRSLLLRDFGLEAFYASDDIPKRGTDDWVKVIRTEVSRCKCFVPILTKNSVDRPWVLYEAGAADALKKPFCRIKSKDLTFDQIRRTLPGPERLASELDSDKAITNFVIKIHRTINLESEHEDVIFKKIQKSPRAKALMRMLSTRNIFMSGSYFKGDRRLDPVRIKGHSHLKGPAALGHVTRDIVCALLEHGFVFWCYPFVSDVGRNVAVAVNDWCKENHKNWSDYFRHSTGGAVPEMMNEEDREDDLNAMLDKSYRHDRKLLIDHQEWVVVLGGNSKTVTECELAQDSKSVKLCPIPIFDGVAYEYWQRDSKRKVLPVSDNDLVWDQDVCQRLAAYLVSN